MCYTVASLYNEVLGMTNDFLYPRNSKNLDIKKPRYQWRFQTFRQGRGGGGSQTFFSFGPQFSLTIREVQGPLPWIHHWLSRTNSADPFVTIEVRFLIFYYYRGEEDRSLYRGLRGSTVLL